MKVIVATHNRDKLREIKALFRNLPVELIDLENYPDFDAVEETGETLQENALLKARAALRTLGLPAIADDTGLEVDALDGAPGVLSARFSGPEATYRSNVDLLLEKLAGKLAAERNARFRTCAVYVDGTQELITQGVVAGAISFAPRGSQGFGYDPVFLFPGAGKTFGEMEMVEKDRYSHRGKALWRLAAHLMQV